MKNEDLCFALMLPRAVQAGIVKMVIMRYHFAEIHECSLKVEAWGSHRCTLHIAWNDSVQRWEDAMLATGGALPHPLAQKIKHLMRTSMADAVFSFDELSSSECLSEYAEAVSKRTRRSHMLSQLIERFVSSEETKAELLKWSGVRAVSKFAMRMLQLQFWTKTNRRS